ncbi:MULTISPECIES: TIGR03854 family LLM class F420-dependent oxidoreductase [Pseudonocardia]|uniref:Limonene 1,2-monooxygenase n=2 Tax=Pseudonocardia TaxID=1847 RepID=A0A1Y2N3Y6_PSEAH|nr:MULTISPECIES: TIGR03854 family LLM class F420-dependent oxidoreductase [Pseudonocardia]OSY41797.1 Limonene 1,2-monooxygenase [Pseudonocardia autotrophica]TDN71151.1 putative F420-dependent oxidoreductase [Pseudonocardia autotrophica]BBG01820.1 LLM class F420-dependent oxidoreductase [Pseudonocardia autotrophica]GEC22986.1 LLM class F420-dependent oxidoreductase [Pseudonocardia saturnea]
MVVSPHGKVRIGVGLLGARSLPDLGTEFDELLDALDKSAVDSLWLADLPSTGVIEATVGSTWAAARTRRLKVGTGLTVLPGRNPMLLAAELASLAVLAPKRILPVFGIRAASPHDRQLYPVPGRLAAVFEESITVLRRLLTEDSVTHHGEFFTLDDATIVPRPAQPLDLWFGGRADAGLRRVGRLADGWLASFLTPAETARGRGIIEQAARDAGRTIDDDHYGTNVWVAVPGTDIDAALARAALQRPDIDPRELVGIGWDGIAELIRRHVEGGLTKFVVRPSAPIADWAGYLDEFTAELGPLESG